MTVRKRRKSKGWLVYPRQKRWVVKYKDSPGPWREHRVPARYGTRSQATVYARAWLAEMKRLGGRKPSSIDPSTDPGPTMRELAKRWLPHRRDREQLRAQSWKQGYRHEGGLAKSTVDANESHLEKWILPQLGDCRSERLADDGVLEEFMRQLLSRPTATGRPAAPATIRHIHATLVAFFDDAMTKRWLDLAANPAKHPAVVALVPKAHPDEACIIHVTPAAAAKAIVHSETAWHRARLLLAFTTGCNNAELSGLVFDDVDQQTKVLSVHRQYTGNGGLGPVKRRHRERDLPLHPLTAMVLRLWKDHGWARWVGRSPTGNDPLFPSPKGGFRYPFGAARELRVALVAAGLSDRYKGKLIDFHAARRSVRTWLVDAGVSDENIDSVMGHAPRSVGRRHYTATDVERLRPVVEKINLDLAVEDVIELPSADPAGADPPEFGAALGATCAKSTSVGLPGTPTFSKENKYKALVAQRIEQWFPKPLAAGSTPAGGALLF